jgi:hypothetical protein
MEVCAFTAATFAGNVEDEVVIEVEVRIPEELE